MWSVFRTKEQTFEVIANKFYELIAANKTDASKLLVLYESLPSGCTKLFYEKCNKENLLTRLEVINHYHLLFNRDENSWFLDSSSALVKILSILANDNYLINYYNQNPSVLKETYSAIDGESKYEGITMRNRTIFTSILTEMMHRYPIKERFVNSTFMYEKNKYLLDSNVLSINDEFIDKIFLKQKENITTTKKIPGRYRRDGEAGYYEPEHTEVSSEIRDLHSGYYHPLDLINFMYEGELMVVPAIFIKSISDENEWKEIMLNIRIGINVIALAIGIASLGSASPFLLALAYTDIAYSVIDTGVALAEEELQKTEEGRAFLDAWTKVTLGVAVANAPLLIRTIFTNGARLFLKATQATKDAIGKMMVKVILEQEILTFAGNTVKATTSVEIKILEYNSQTISKATAFAFGRYDNILPLYEKGSVLVEIGEKEYALAYKGEKLIQGTPNDKYLLKFNQELKKTFKNPEKLKDLLEIAYKEAQIQRRVKEMEKWIDGNTKKPYGIHELETLAQMEIEQKVVLRATKSGEAGDAIVEQGKQIGESWDAMGLTNTQGAIRQWSKKYTRERRLFFESIDTHFRKFTPDPIKGIPALDKLIIDGKHFDLFNKSLKADVIEHIKDNYPQYYNTSKLELLNFKN